MSIKKVFKQHFKLVFNDRGQRECQCGFFIGNGDNAGKRHKKHAIQVLEQHEREREAAALEEAAESLNPELINYRRDAMEVLSQRIQPAGGNDTLSLQLALVAAKRSREWLHNRAEQLKESR